MEKSITSFLIFLVAIGNTFATNYYCDPASGNMSNPGTSASPWSTLEAVFTANKTFAAADIIYLRKGYHGFPAIKGNNSGYVSIQPESGHAPTVKKISVTNATKWIISGLTVSPEVVNSYEGGTFVDIRSSSSYITLQNCFIYSTLNPAGWSQTDWETRTGDGIICSGPNCLITNNHIKNIDFGLSLNATAKYSVVSHNTFENIAGDGLRGLSNYSKFEYNTVKNFYVANANHDDIFQSWSAGSGGVGTDTVIGIEIRGNTFISHTDPKQALVTHPQGIGCFDGMFKDWIIENNLIVTEHWHGISLYGAINCRIVNNTLVENPLNLDASMVPWIKITAHKNGKPATGNLVRNNFTSSMSNDAHIGTADFNIVAKNYTSHFVNYAGFDFHLKSNSPAINAGSNINTPTIDLAKKGRVVPYDVGCYEYGAITAADNNIGSDKANSILVYPNPVWGNEISIDLGELNYGKTTIELIDLNGRILYKEATEGTNRILTIKNYTLESGMYIIRIDNNKTVVNRKLMLR
jgi:parallel beta-helix repeat protein